MTIRALVSFLRRGAIRARQIGRTRATDSDAVQVKLRGGLGNQLFGYAAGLELAHRSNLGLRLVTSAFDAQGMNTEKQFELGELLTETVSSGPEVNGRYFFEKGFAFNERFLKLSGPVVLDGYFQSSRYFPAVGATVRSNIRQTSLFTSGTNSAPSHDFIGVQIRRGDYKNLIQTEFHGLVPMEFFTEAVELVRAVSGDLHVVVFSDEYEYATDLAASLADASAHMPKPGQKPMEVLGMLSAAKALIVSNSSFGWWAAYLARQGSTVVVPRPWFRSRGVDTTDLLERSWLTLGYENKL